MSGAVVHRLPVKPAARRKSVREPRADDRAALLRLMRIEDLEAGIAAWEARAKSHADTLFIYERLDRPGHLANWLSHKAQIADADWRAQLLRDELDKLVKGGAA